MCCAADVRAPTRMNGSLSTRRLVTPLWARHPPPTALSGTSTFRPVAISRSLRSVCSVYMRPHASLRDALLIPRSVSLVENWPRT